MENRIFAHSANEDGNWQKLSEHLVNVAEKAAVFAKEFASEDWAYNIGLLHDLGKASKAFQEYIKSRSNQDNDADGFVPKTNHSGAGAICAIEELKYIGKIMAYCIAGHHAGLADWDIGNASLKSRVGEDGNGHDKKYIDNEVEEYFKNIKPELKQILNPPHLKNPQKDLHLWIRMLYSCLVDADFLDTESHMNCGQKDRGMFNSIEELLNKFFLHMKKFDNPENELNKIRCDILKKCEEKASQQEGFFELTVPTGGGKTLSSMAFAFKHALKFNKKRIIYVIPYTSIIEQTSKILKDILGDDNIIEHHSNIDPDKETEKSRLACENWDAPVIVTTNVQFFETLYGVKSSKCRKLHNIANSVIILDEAQTLPPEFIYPIEDIMRQLVDNYKCSLVFSTATQPYFKTIKDIERIIPKEMDLYQKLKRVVYHFPKKDEPNENWQSVAEKLKRYNKVLCVVNTRRDCYDLYKLIPENTMHLSALMCAEHRSKKITEVKEKLKNNEDIKVISTQLIEAGVDIDFPVVFRSFAGLNSIVQTAGRCNREGKLQSGEVFIFNPPKAAPAGLLRKSADATKDIIYCQDFNIDNEETYKKFFQSVISRANSIGKKELEEYLFKDAYNQVCQFNFQFATYQDIFNIIDDNYTVPIIVRYGDNDNLIDELKNSKPTKSLMRKLQRYTVNIPKNIFDKIQNKLIEVYSGIYSNGYVEYDEAIGLNIFEDKDVSFDVI